MKLKKAMELLRRASEGYVVSIELRLTSSGLKQWVIQAEIPRVLGGSYLWWRPLAQGLRLNEVIPEAVRKLQDVLERDFTVRERRAKIEKDLREDRAEAACDDKADMDRDDRRDAKHEDFRHMGEGD